MKRRSGEMSSSNGNKVERKTIEKNRRIEMKSLCWKMVNLIPQNHLTQPKEVLSQQDQVEQAAGYIQQLSARIDELKEKKTQLALINNNNNNNNNSTKTTATSSTESELLPILRLREMGSSSNDLEVILISGIRRNFKICEAISILEEEGAEVLTLNTSNMGHKIFHIIHAKVKFSRIGMDISRICGRLQELIS